LNSFEFDLQYGIRLVAGFDEAGCGPCAGPVVASCVVLPSKLLISHPLDDSKALSERVRFQLAPELMKQVRFGIGYCSPKLIDRINIYHASRLAMRRAYKQFIKKYELSPRVLLVDGNRHPFLDHPCYHNIVRGDSKSASIMAASVIAKVTRDRIMQLLDKLHPEYGWYQNKGYGTKQHVTAIQEVGVTKYHRLSFRPCRIKISD
jgi:ribonuclease HII